MNTRRIVSVGFILGLALAFLWAGQESAEQLYKSGLYEEEVSGNLQKAIGVYQDLLKRFPASREVAAKAQLHIGLCYEKLGLQEAPKAFQKVVDNYPEQAAAVATAKDKLAALLRARNAVESPEGGLRIRKLGSVEVLGGPSPDGRLISCVDWDTGDLAVFDIASGKMHRLTNKVSWAASSEFAEESTFSPDGKTIAYNWYNEGNDRYDLRIIRADGTNQRILYSDQGVSHVWPCGWTPDGQGIISILTGTGRNKPSRIALVSASDGAVRTVKEFPSEAPGKLSLSPDGRWIAFDYPYPAPLREGSEKRDIFVLPIDGGRELPLVTHPADDCMLGWSPDGQSILFSSDRSGAWDAWMQPVENGVVKGEPRLLKRDFGDPETWPMGVTKNGSLYYGLRYQHLDVFIVSMDPSTGGPQARPQKAALRFEGSNGYPCWSPDGSRLAYTSLRRQDKSKPAALCVKTMASGEEREFFPQVKELFHTVAWFPDGHSILCRGMVEPRRPFLFRYDLDKGETEKLLVLDGPQGGLHGPMLSGDGKRIFYDLDDFGNKTFRVMSYDLVTNQKKELIRGPNQIVDYDLSRDGKRLAFKEVQDGIARLSVMPSEGGEKATLLKLGEGQGINSVAWSPDGRTIYFSKWEKGSSTGNACSLWRIAAAGGQAERFDMSAVGLSVLCFRPDGGKLAFMSWRVETEAWVMENFLPADKAKK